MNEEEQMTCSGVEGSVPVLRKVDQDHSNEDAPVRGTEYVRGIGRDARASNDVRVEAA